MALPLKEKGSCDLFPPSHPLPSEGYRGGGKQESFRMGKLEARKLYGRKHILPNIKRNSFLRAMGGGKAELKNPPFPKRWFSGKPQPNFRI